MYYPYKKYIIIIFIIIIYKIEIILKYFINYYYIMSSYIYDRILERINIPANYINKKLDERILEFIKRKIGDKCIETGYVNSDDIEIIGRTNGLMDVSHFTGNIVFDVECKVKIFNPPDGVVLLCKVVNKNKMGIVAESANIDPSPIRVLLAREHHQDNDKFDLVNINENIYVQIIAKRYEYNDTQIQAIGILSNKKSEQESSIDDITKSISSQDSTDINPDDSSFVPEDTSVVPEDTSVVPEDTSVPKKQKKKRKKVLVIEE